MKNSLQLMLIAAVVAGCASTATPPVNPYILNNAGETISGGGSCIRTSAWSKDLAQSVKGKDGKPIGCECDKAEMPAGVCEPAKAAAPAAPAAAKPAAPAAPAAAAKPAAPAPAAVKVTVPADALFAFNSSDLTAEGKERLENYALSLTKMKLEVVIAVGHADRIGTEKYNQALSEKRAEAVKAILIANGVEANRIYTEGKGSSQPKTGKQCNSVKGAKNGSNKKYVACLAEDRRVDLEAVGTFVPKVQK